MTYLHQVTFTSGLREKIDLYRAQVERWAEQEMAHIDAQAEKYHEQASQRQAALDEAMTNYVTLKLQANCKVEEAVRAEGTVKEMEEQAHERRQEIASHQRTLEEKAAMIRDLRLDVVEEEEAVQAAAQQLELMRNHYTSRLEKLQLILDRYKYLGLEFESAKENALRLVFTQIDPRQPEKKFSIVQSTNDEDEYIIINSEPELDATTVLDLVEKSNSEDGGLSQFVRDARRVFVSLAMNAQPKMQ